MVAVFGNARQEVSVALSRDDILARRGKRRLKTVSLPDGSEVVIRSLSELEKSTFEQSQLVEGEGGRRRSDPEQIKRSRVKLLVLCLCDVTGCRLLRDEDVESLLELDGLDCEILYDAIQAHVGYDLPKNNLETVAKNSGTTPAAASPSS